jgi:hypothetical protein
MAEYVKFRWRKRLPQRAHYRQRDDQIAHCSPADDQ